MTFEARLADNLAAIRARIADAAQASGRSPGDITLVAVTKYVDIEILRELFALGCTDLGESRPQELWSKAAALSDVPQVRWHLVGHLQRNKVERTLPLVALIHSVDSLRLLEAINGAATAQARQVSVLLEINISREPAKHGFAPTEVEPNLIAIAELESVEVRGLMTMASREGDVSQARSEFAKLRELRDRLRTVAPASIHLDELSMGMSGDFEAAIAQGATIVRIGSALIEGVANNT